MGHRTRILRRFRQASRRRTGDAGAADRRDFCRPRSSRGRVDSGTGAGAARLSGRRAAAVGDRSRSSMRCARAAIGGTAISPISRGLIDAAAAHGASAHRAQSAARAVSRSRRGGQPLRAEQPAFPQSALHRRRGDRGISRRCRGWACRRKLAALRERDLIDYAGVARAKLAALRLAHDAFPRLGKRASGAPISTPTARSRATRCCASPASKCLRQHYAPHALAANGRQPWRSPESRRPAALPRSKHDEAANSTNSCSGSPIVNCAPARTPRADTACRSGSMSISPSASIRTAPTPGANRARCSTDVSIGAPPDEFNPGGQDWGLAPFNPHALPADDFAPCAA